MKSLAASLFSLSVLLAAYGAAAADERLLVTAGGERVAASLVRIEADGRYVFDVAGQPRELRAAELVSWGAPTESSQGVQIVLDREALVVAADVELSGEELAVEGSSLWSGARRTSALRLPLALVAGVLFQPSADTDARDRFLLAIASDESNSERLFLANGDELSGTLVELTRSSLEFESSVGKIDVELDKVAALAFDPALRTKEADDEAGLMVGLAGGTRLRVASITTDEQVATLVLADDVTWRVDLSAIVWLRPAHADVVFLSDLAPASYRHLPFLDLAWPYELDRSVAGGLLRSGGQLYLKGVSMHSTARLTWDLDRPWRRFEAEIALDDSAGKRGSVVFRVFTDGKEAFASPVVRGGEPPQSVSVDVRGAKRLSLIVDFADRGDELDHADWFNARLIR